MGERDKDLKLDDVRQAAANAAEVVSTWPRWKQRLGGQRPTVARVLQSDYRKDPLRYEMMAGEDVARVEIVNDDGVIVGTISTMPAESNESPAEAYARGRREALRDAVEQLRAQAVSLALPSHYSESVDWQREGILVAARFIEAVVAAKESCAQCDRGRDKT